MRWPNDGPPCAVRDITKRLAWLQSEHLRRRIHRIWRVQREQKAERARRARMLPSVFQQRKAS